MKQKILLLFLGVFFALSVDTKAALRTATLTGDFNVASTWQPATVPVSGDSIVINAGKTVNVTASLNWDGGGCVKTILVIKGTLVFQNGKKMNLCCGSRVYIYPGGLLDANGAPANSNWIQICGTPYWNSGAGNVSGPGCFVPTDPICVLFLPIELLYFNAEVCNNNKQVCLNWSTATEINNNYFTVERSVDATEFTEVTKVTGAGTSYYNHNYNATDEHPLSGLSYYRLKQTDFDNSFTYSPIVAIALDFEISVQNPSPAFDIPLTIKGNKGESFEIKLIDVLGRVCYDENFTLETTGNNKIDLNLSNRFSSCVLYLVVSNNLKSINTKVVID